MIFCIYKLFFAKQQIHAGRHQNRWCLTRLRSSRSWCIDDQTIQPEDCLAAPLIKELSISEVPTIAYVACHSMPANILDPNPISRALTFIPCNPLYWLYIKFGHEDALEKHAATWVETHCRYARSFAEQSGREQDYDLLVLKFWQLCCKSSKISKFPCITWCLGIRWSERAMAGVIFNVLYGRYFFRHRS